MDKNELGEMQVGRDYRLTLVDCNNAGLYLNGLCESTHGMGDAGSLSLVSIRAKQIVESIQRLRAQAVSIAPCLKEEA